MTRVTLRATTHRMTLFKSVVNPLVSASQGASDLGDAHAVADEQLACDLVTHFVQQPAE
jgi:hypothetical protein